MTVLLDHEPSDFYAGAFTEAEINRLEKEAFAIQAEAYGGPLLVPSDVVQRIQADARLAWVRFYAALPKDRPASRQRPHVERTSKVAGKGPEVEMTCDQCKGTKSERKFPTLAKGGRGTTCRDCVAEARKAKKGES